MFVKEIATKRFFFLKPDKGKIGWIEDYREDSTFIEVRCKYCNEDPFLFTERLSYLIVVYDTEKDIFHPLVSIVDLPTWLIAYTLEVLKDKVVKDKKLDSKEIRYIIDNYVVGWLDVIIDDAALGLLKNEFFEVMSKNKDKKTLDAISVLIDIIFIYKFGSNNVKLPSDRSSFENLERVLDLLLKEAEKNEKKSEWLNFFSYIRDRIKEKGDVTLDDIKLYQMFESI
ncbi:MAG: hypothetical protein DSY42_05120 [Aquifex sp.]|nr:MAG: hypothetical protein DSY42_05120 [Aquifex sp.]